MCRLGSDIIFTEMLICKHHKFVLAVLCLLFIWCFSFSVYGVPSHDFTPFLRWGLGARPMGMGKAFSFLADDPNAIYYNPAGLGFLSKIQFETQLGQQFYRIDNNYFGITKDNIGLGYLTYGMGVIPYWKTNGTYQEFDNKNSSLLILAYGQKLSPSFSVGGSLKSFSIDADHGYVAGKSADVGLLFRPDYNWQFGVVAQDLITVVDNFRATKSDPNVGPQSSSDVLFYPNLKIGFVNRNYFCNFMAEVINLGFTEQLHLGTERWLDFILDSQFAFRLGMYGKLASYLEGTRDLTKSAGLGIQRGSFELNSAVELYPDMGTSLRFAAIIGLENAWLTRFSQVGMFPFFGTLSLPESVPPAADLIPRSPPEPEESSEDEAEEETGGLVVDVNYSCVPRSPKHGANTAEITLVRFPAQREFDPVLAPQALVPRHPDFPSQGRQPDFMTGERADLSAYQGLPTQKFKNIQINRTDKPTNLSRYGGGRRNPGGQGQRPPAGVSVNTITNLVAGKYLVKVEATRSLPWYDEIYIYPNQFTTVTATLELAHGAVSGSVINKQGSRVTNASLQIAGKSANVNARGEFSIPNLPTGSHLLKIIPEMPSYLSREIIVQVPSSYRELQLGQISLEAYVATGDVWGTIAPFPALSGFVPGTFHNKDVAVYLEYGGHRFYGTVDLNDGDFNFSDVTSGVYYLRVQPVAGWYPKEPRLVNVPAMNHTLNVGTITLQPDPEYLPDLRIKQVTLYQERYSQYGGGWQEYPATHGKDSYRVQVEVENLGPAPAPSFLCEVSHKITPTSGGVQQRFLAEWRLCADNLYPGNSAEYYIEFHDLSWEPNAINELVVKLDPVNGVTELNESNNEEVLVFGPASRDAGFHFIPQLVTVTPRGAVPLVAPSLYTQMGNSYALAPGDRLRFRAWVDGIVGGDEVLVSLVDKDGVASEVRRVTMWENNLDVEFPLDRPGKWMVRFELNAAGDTDPADNQIEVGPYYVLVADGAVTYFESNTREIPRYTSQPITVQINFKNESTDLAEGGFVDYQVALHTADDIDITFADEPFPSLPAGDESVLVSIPAGVLASGVNVLRVTFTDAASPDTVIKCFTREIQSEVDPQYLTDHYVTGKKVLHGVDSPFLCLNNTYRTHAQGEYYSWRYFDKEGYPFGIGLGASADDWLGERSQINGYISKSFYIESADGKLYNSAYAETVQKRKKDTATLFLLVDYAGVIDSNLFMATIFPTGMDYYLAKIDTGLAAGDQSYAPAENNLLYSANALPYLANVLVAERGFPHLEIATSLAVEILTPGRASFTVNLLRMQLQTRGYNAHNAIKLSEYLCSRDTDLSNWMGYFKSLQFSLGVKEALVDERLYIFPNVPIEEGSYYTFFVKAEVQARCGGVAWSVADFQGCYSKKDKAEEFAELKRGIWLTGAAIHFSKNESR